MRKWMSLLFVLVMVAIVAACDGGSDESETAAAGEPAAQEVVAAALEVAMGDLFYGARPDNMQNPPVWTVTAGGEVQLELKNAGTLQHNWAIVKPGSEVPVPFMVDDNSDIILWQAGLVDPATEKTETFTAPEAGEYTVICTVAGHFPSMQGKLVVQ